MDTPPPVHAWVCYEQNAYLVQSRWSNTLSALDSTAGFKVCLHPGAHPLPSP